MSFKLPRFNYTFVEEFPFESKLEEMKDHRRFAVFYNKGCSCVTCGKTFNRIIKGVDRVGVFHTDLYNSNLSQAYDFLDLQLFLQIGNTRPSSNFMDVVC